MSKKNPKTLTVERAPDQTSEQATAEVAVNPAMNAAFVVDTYQSNILGDDVDTDALVATLRASMDKSAAGDLSGLESMLIGQATALQTIFVSLAKRAHHQQYQRHLEAFLGLALKAQAQSRATIQAVIDLKFPRQATFVKQANIAHGPQQVNNGHANGGDTVRALENQTEQIEVLEGATHGGKEMDTRATAEAARGNPAVEALATGHRPKKRGR
ncbi:hypothetical protein [Hydrogenophaga defluvii]|uniref:Killing trait domain-containing protein n=1 Tax=Hydrogenophaga defluvii TaxID=249410 RepID=A0ABW2SGN6_9BURK